MPKKITPENAVDVLVFAPKARIKLLDKLIGGRYDYSIGDIIGGFKEVFCERDKTQEPFWRLTVLPTSIPVDAVVEEFAKLNRPRKRLIILHNELVNPSGDFQTSATEIVVNTLKEFTTRLPNELPSIRIVSSDTESLRKLFEKKIPTIEERLTENNLVEIPRVKWSIFTAKIV